ncbi:MAG: cell division protein FtsA [Candidatus Nealsonbacteria bacterium]|nr:cell division protein FtsA [Candidatus Nealsonbacteria bacterium]
MAKNRIICGLDIGTSEIKVLAAVKTDNRNLEVLGQARYPSFGLRRGTVVKPEEVSKRISEAMAQLSQELGQKIEDVYINIGGSHIFATPSSGSIVVSRADQRISEEDKNRVIQTAQTFSLPSNKEILNIFPREFIVDDQGKIKDPLNMQGLRLEVKILALCAFSPFLKNLTAAVLEAGFQISDIIPSAIAAARAVLTPQQKELGVCLLDIGAGTTDMALYEEGDLAHLAVFPVGSELITHDIAIGLKTDIETAEKIKKEFGSCVLKGGDKKEKIIPPQHPGNGEPLVFNHKMLVKIIEARVSEIFSLALQELKRVSPKSILPAGIVLTGGGAMLPKIVEFAKKETKLPCRIGLPEGIAGLSGDPSISAAVGLILEGSDLEMDAGGIIIPVLNSGFAEKIKKAFKFFIP